MRDRGQQAVNTDERSMPRFAYVCSLACSSRSHSGCPKHDLQARPVYHHQRDSIEAHLTVVFAALAVSRWIEARTGWSIRKFVKTARRYRTVEIQAGEHTITAADLLPDDLRGALDRIHRDSGAH